MLHFAAGTTADLQQISALTLTAQACHGYVHCNVLNRQDTAWAAVSGAKFVPPGSFQGYL